MSPARTRRDSLDAVRLRAGKILLRWRRGGQTIEDLLEAELASRPMEHREHARLRELLFGCMHALGRHEFVIGRHAKRGSKMPEAAWVSLVLALQEISAMRTPEHAAVDQAVALCRRLGAGHAARFVNGVLRSALRDGLQAGVASADGDPVAHAVQHLSHPEWMVRRWERALGADEMLRLCAANNRRPSLVLRCAPGMRASVGRRLTELELDWEQAASADGIRLRDRLPVPLLLEQLGTAVAIQDEAAQLVAPMLAAAQPSTVVDLCAAPGGKAGHLAQLLPSARILALDLSGRRLGRLRENASRLGLGNLGVARADGRRPPIASASVDAVLLDAPCTGTGVVARRHDLRWRRKESDLPALLQLQRELLAGAVAILRPGGTLLYSTCSLEPEENQEMVEWALERFAELEEWPLDATEIGMDSSGDVSFFQGGRLQAWPHRHGCDGAFATRLRTRGA